VPETGQTAPPARGRPGPIFFGWYIVGAGFLIEGLGYGARYSFSVFFPTLIQEFGWPRDMAASILSIHLLCYGLVAPLAGSLVDRVGARRTMLSGTGLLALGLALSRFGNAPWHFFLSFGVLTGAGLCLLGSVPLTAVIRNWFERRRGAALSLIYVGSGGAYACYPAVAWLIDRLGWRQAFLAEGFIVAAILVPAISLAMVYHPSQKGLGRDGLAVPEPGSVLLRREERRIVDGDWAAREWTLAAAVRTGRFWLLCLSAFAMWGVGNHLLVTHQIAFALDAGFPRLYASAVLSLNGLLFGLGCLASLISDRIGREATMTVGTGLCLTGIAALLMIRDASQAGLLYYYAVSTGFGFGMCVPAVAATVTDIFQGPRVGSIIGCIWFGFALGGTVGPWLGGWLFELGGDYLTAFAVAGLMYVLGLAGIWLAGPGRVRLVPGRVRG